MSTGLVVLKLIDIINKTNVRGKTIMNNQSPFELVDGQVVLHNNYQNMDKIILNYEQVAAIKMLIQKYSGKENDQMN